MTEFFKTYQGLMRGATINGKLDAAQNKSVFFQVYLNANDYIELYSSGLELWVYDGRKSLVPEVIDAALGGCAEQHVKVKKSGVYKIELYIPKGSSEYKLYVSDGTKSCVLTPPELNLSTNIRTQELPIKLKPDATAFSNEFLPSAGLVHKRGRLGSWSLWDIECVDTALATLECPSLHRDMVLTETQTARFYTLSIVKQLRTYYEVVDVTVNECVSLMGEPNDPYYEEQWGHSQIGLPFAWEITKGYENEVIVAVIDSGVFLQHEDLQNKLVIGYDFVNNIIGGADPGDGDTLEESSWHGTLVAGIIAAEMDNGIGIAGVSGGAKIMPLRVYGSGGATVYDIVEAIRYAAALDNSSGQVPFTPAQVINISMGSGTPSPLYDDLIPEINDMGIIIIAAAGNDGDNGLMYPAAFPGVISVAATNDLGVLASYSNYGTTIDVAAPGGDVNSPTGRGIFSTSVKIEDGQLLSDYRVTQGTSFAAPYMSGVVALMKSLYPSLDFRMLKDLLTSGDITYLSGVGQTIPDSREYPIIDAYSAVKALEQVYPILQSRFISGGSTTTLSNTIGEYKSSTVDYSAFVETLFFKLTHSVNSTANAEDSFLLTLKQELATAVRASIEVATLGNYLADCFSGAEYVDVLDEILTVLYGSEVTYSEALWVGVNNALRSRGYGGDNTNSIGVFQSVVLDEGVVVEALSFIYKHDLMSLLECDDTLFLGRLLHIIDEVRGHDSTVTTLEALLAITTMGWLEDQLGFRQGASLLSTAGDTASLITQVIGLASLADVLDSVDELTTSLGLMVALHTSADGTLTADTVVSAFVDLFSSVSGVAITLSLDNERYIGYVMNTNTDAFSYYKNTNFDSLAWSYNTKELYAAATDGIYVFDGDDDTGAAIHAQVMTGVLDFQSDQLKRVDRAYLGYAGGKLLLRVITTMGGHDQVGYYELINNPADTPTEGVVRLAKGLRSAYWQFELHNIDGADFEVDNLTLYPVMLSRRRNS